MAQAINTACHTAVIVTVVGASTFIVVKVVDVIKTIIERRKE